LKNLPLRWLVINNNQLQDISALRDIPTLENLYLEHNQISNIEVLLEMPKLKSVMLEGNPLNEQAASVIEHLKNKGVAIKTSEASTGTKNDSIRILLDAQNVSFDQAPFISNGTMLVQFRPLFEQLGLKISWDAGTKTITGEKKGTRIKLQLDNSVAEVNGNKVELPVPPTLVNNNTFVPLRFISESVEAKVEWVDASRSAVIQTKREFETKEAEFHLMAYGKWDHVSYQESPPELLFALKYLLIYKDSKNSNRKDTTLVEFIKQSKDERGITKGTVIEEKKIRLFDRDAIQLTYVDDSDWPKLPPSSSKQEVTFMKS
jgi:Leucine-rich repeat (LRR) protein